MVYCSCDERSRTESHAGRFVGKLWMVIYGSICVCKSQCKYSERYLFDIPVFYPDRIEGKLPF